MFRCTLLGELCQVHEVRYYIIGLNVLINIITYFNVSQKLHLTAATMANIRVLCVIFIINMTRKFTVYYLFAIKAMYINIILRKHTFYLSILLMESLKYEAFEHLQNN